jgi:cell cycle serine/threonine-protein kinase CDC5/MSD2
MRPILHEIVDHPFFTDGPVPAYIPTSAHDAPPDFRRITKSASLNNLRRLRRHSLLDEDQVTTIAVPKAPETAPAPSLTKSMTSSIAQQEKEFQKAVQPGSPISALLSSARQPLLMSNNNGGGAVRESPLLRKLQAVKESPLGRRPPVMRGLNGIVEEEGAEGGAVRGRDEHQEEEMKSRKKELDAQKARIVAQMAPVREEEEDYMVEKQRNRERVRVRTTVDRENVPPPMPAPALVQAPTIAKGRERERDFRVVGRERVAVPGQRSIYPVLLYRKLILLLE